MPKSASIFRRAGHPFRAAAKAGVFFLKVFPMLPSRAVDWVTPTPTVQKVRYPTSTGFAEGDVYRPSGPGPYPAVLVCLGVVPFEVNHPQVPVLGKALARAGFAALLYWSPAMRDFRLDPEDLENIPLAYDWLIRQPYVDAGKSGLLGTCVGGSFALMAAAHALIRDRVAWIGAYAPFSSMWTFARDIASATVDTEDGVKIWRVDQLTRKVFTHSLTEQLESGEAQRLRAAFEGVEAKRFDPCDLSADGRSIYDLLNTPGRNEMDTVLRQLPPNLQETLTVLSPMTYTQDLRAPLIAVLHDRGDQLIPIGESRRLIAALNGRPGLHFTEMNFSHLDPVKGKLPFFRLLRELGKFFRAVLPMFWEVTE
jgi:dipeptidyl aminopeptidase/acylaminoacyl peptidase